ncbi:MAG: tRNA (adenosine(37)-N6)-threonylcarbamoyltransferase complex transferase subunit TsaD [Bacteroidota bacterium]
MPATILAIESSCDETSAAIISDGKILNNIVATQSIHEKYGGVVPELASRAHQKNIVPVVELTFQEAGITKNELDAVAFTQGPGLLGALLVGNSFAKGMALGLNIPLISVNHMQAHILAHFIEDPKPEFPFLCLTVSGGHTQIVLVEDHLKMKIIGETLDDAVGEAFDKIAKILGIPYPGGPLIDKYAKSGNSDRFSFSKSEMKDYDYSFSGIKTSVLYYLRKELKSDPDFIANNLHDLCASVQKILVEMLLLKLKKASKELGINEVAIAGGVSANSHLRTEMKRLSSELNWDIYIPAFEYCTDNAAMIAMTAHYKFLNNDFDSLASVPMPRLKFE